METDQGRDDATPADKRACQQGTQTSTQTTAPRLDSTSGSRERIAISISYRKQETGLDPAKRIGRSMQQVDIMIAAIVFSLGNCSVVTADSELAALPGLPVENWAV